MRVIAIDGPAGAGKSTIAKALADRLGLEYLDTGAMYRAVTLAAMRASVATSDLAAVASLAARMSLEVTDTVVLDGVDVTAAIRTPEVTVAHEHGGGVIEGCDIGTVVFPDAELKLYLTASPRVRAERRVGESGGDVEEIAAAIAARDEADLTRVDSPLAEADSAILVDTSGLGIDDVLAVIEDLLAKQSR
jgi:cytidylate kinase